MAKTDSDLMKEDLYQLLDIAEDATNKEISNAYRKKAREYHPDKNPDNPEKAKELFDLIKKAKDLLTDIGKRAEYDHKRKAKRAAKERVQQFDAKRQKMTKELEERERQYKEKLEKEEAEKKKLSEIDKMRAENRKWMAMELLKEQKKKEQRKNAPGRLIVKWSKSKCGEAGEYNQQKLDEIFSRYGDMIVSYRASKRKALVEFPDPNHAVRCKKYELGLPQNLFKSMEWFQNEVPVQAYQEPDYTSEPNVDDFEERERRFRENLKFLQTEKEKREKQRLND